MNWTKATFRELFSKTVAQNPSYPGELRQPRRCGTEEWLLVGDEFETGRYSSTSPLHCFARVISKVVLRTSTNHSMGYSRACCYGQLTRCCWLWSRLMLCRRAANLMLEELVFLLLDIRATQIWNEPDGYDP